MSFSGEKKPLVDFASKSVDPAVHFEIFRGRMYSYL
jgi:hypothetical protein